MKSKKLFDKPKEVFEAQINDLFDKKDDTETHKLIQAYSLILDMNNSSRDIVDLFNLLGMDNFISVVSLFEKRTVTFPSKEDIKESMIVAVLFYYKEIMGYEWPEIKEIIPFEFSPISYSNKLKKFNTFMYDNLKEVLKENE